MNPQLELVGRLDWLLTHSLQAGVLVLLVLGIQWIFRLRLTNRWRFALWWIVLARLLLPFSPQSALSLFNLVTPKVRLESPVKTPAAPVIAGTREKINPSETIHPTETPAAFEPSHQEGLVVSAPDSAPGMAVPPAAGPRRSLSFKGIFISGVAGLWLMGIVVLSIVVVLQSLRFNRKLGRAGAPPDPKLQELLDECRREFGVTRRIELLETAAVKSPALFGLWRLRLLVPHGFGTQFASRELRYIFLHEVAHVKRGDLWLNWLVTALQILHWFNPLLWLGFARLRADRELACDELALLRAGDSAGTAYGETVVKLLENLSRPAAIPGLVGILEDKKQMRRRISMIVNFRPPGRWSMLAVLLIAAVAAAALTDAQSQKTSSNAASPSVTNAPAHWDLTGTVRDAANRPVTNATISIDVSRSKDGSGAINQSSPDYQKSAVTDGDGKFVIKALEANATYNVLIIASGFQPELFYGVQPGHPPEPLEIKLVPPASGLRPEQQVHGRVVGPDGAPVGGALVEVHGAHRDEGWREPAWSDIDAMAITDDSGAFAIRGASNFISCNLIVKAHGFAPSERMDEVATGDMVHEIRLVKGATLNGRLLKGGQPVPNAAIAIAGIKTDFFNSRFSAVTDDEGRFSFTNIPADRNYYLFGVMKSLRERGALPFRQVQVGHNGSIQNVGDLSLEPAFKVSGRLLLPGGEPAPKNCILTLARTILTPPPPGAPLPTGPGDRNFRGLEADLDNWESRNLTNGDFEFLGVPAGPVSLFIMVPPFYHVSPRNVSADVNGWRLLGLVNGDKTNLVFELRNGGLSVTNPMDAYDNKPTTAPDLDYYQALSQKPLQGTEATGPSGQAVADPESTAGATRPDLTGMVSGKDGAALPVPATVFISTAGPKTGSSVFCPSCYADCAKHAQTDSQGNFKIESLDPQLVFRILAVAKGYKPQYVSKVDPVNGKPVKIKLEPIEVADATPYHSVRGRVVNARGQPVAGAVVEMNGVENRDGGGGWGAIEGVDPLAVTDEKGEFLITATRQFDTMDVKVSARTYADKLFKLPKGVPNELVIAEGAGLTGRVVQKGKPLGGVSVGVSAVDRRPGSYLGHFEIATGPDGHFSLVNLPPDTDFDLYTLMGSMKEYGAVPIQKIHTGKGGETTDVGDLAAVPAYRLAGRVVLADGQPFPAKTRLLVDREGAWDSMQITLDKDGHFDTTGIPDEEISLNIRVRGYHVSARNLSLDEINPYQLIGRVDHDITDLVLLLDKGPETQPDYTHVDPDYNQSRTRALRGAEGAPDHSHEWVISGHVVDADSGQPIQDFLVTPGQGQGLDQIGWNTMHVIVGSKGVYQIYVSQHAPQPMLKVDAEGYLPQVVNLQSANSAGVDVALRKGSGPSGTVLSPDGTPAVGASVITLNGEFNRANLGERGELTVFGNQSVLHATDAAGHFAFKPEWGVKTVVAASSRGFGMIEATSLATNPVIQLRGFGKVSGTLKLVSGPVTNEDLDIAFAPYDLARGLDMQFHAVTDSQGRFQFDGVPSGQVQISYRQMDGKYGGWRSISLKQFEVKPGRSVVVNIETNDLSVSQARNEFQPPPEPKLIPGGQLKGVVLLPDGKPAADANVAIQVDGKYLGVGKGAFTAGPSPDDSRTTTGPDGSFTLPLYENARSVVALNDEGFAQVSLDQLKQAPQITLQKWGRVEGVLRVGHHPGANERVILDPVMKPMHRVERTTSQVVSIDDLNGRSFQPPTYDPNAFQAHTDDQGRFAITFVPPGQQVVARMVQGPGNSWSHLSLATVEVKPGETVVTNIGGTGRLITGKVKIQSGLAPELAHGIASITTPVSKTLELFAKANQLKTDQERRAFYASNSVAASRKTYRSFPAIIRPDGSFQAEDVPPGTYEFHIQQNFEPNANITSITTFTSEREMVVPPAAGANDDSPVDWGTIELKELTFPVPKPAAM